MALPIIKVHAWGIRLIVFGLVFTGIYCFKLWQPRRQIELHQKNFVTALEERNWSKVKRELAPNYSDRFGHNRETVVTNLQGVLRLFFAVTIRSQGTQFAINEEAATVTANMTLTGTGTGATEFVTSEVNGLAEPWVFSWRKASFWPWDWRLERVDNASLRLPERGAVF